MCVGPGITVGAHMSVRCRNLINRADIVYSSCHPLMEDWLKTMHHDVRSLQPLYAQNKDRRITYKEMVDLMLNAVRENRRVTGVFYGHPGVFAQVPHRAIAAAQREGYRAWMEPGISAEDCLYADLAIDPGAYGCQHMEASQFMFYQRQLDTAGYVILWQVALAGEITLSNRVSSTEQRAVLVELLLAHYPATHEVILYECPTLVTDTVRAEKICLDELTQAALTPITTLVIPPGKKMEHNQQVIDRLSQQAAAEKEQL